MSDCLQNGMVRIPNDLCGFAMPAEVDWTSVHPLQQQMAAALRPVALPLSQFFIPLAVPIGELSQERATLQSKLVEFVWGEGAPVMMRGSASSRHFCVVNPAGLKAAGGLLRCGEGLCGRVFVDEHGRLAVRVDQPHRCVQLPVWRLEQRVLFGMPPILDWEPDRLRLNEPALGDLAVTLSKEQQGDEGLYAVHLNGAALGVPVAATIEQTVRSLVVFGALSANRSARSLRAAFELLFPRWTKGVLAAVLVQHEVTFHAENGAVRIHCPLDLDKFCNSYPSMAELLGYIAQLEWTLEHPDGSRRVAFTMSLSYQAFPHCSGFLDGAILWVDELGQASQEALEIDFCGTATQFEWAVKIAARLTSIGGTVAFNDVRGVLDCSAADGGIAAELTIVDMGDHTMKERILDKFVPVKRIKQLLQQTFKIGLKIERAETSIVDAATERDTSGAEGKGAFAEGHVDQPEGGDGEAPTTEGKGAKGACAEGHAEHPGGRELWQIKFGLNVVLPPINTCFSTLLKRFVAKRLGDAIGFIYDMLFQVGDDLAKLHEWLALRTL